MKRTTCFIILLMTYFLFFCGLSCSSSNGEPGFVCDSGNMDHFSEKLPLESPPQEEQVCRAKKEECNNKDDDCNGAIDDKILPIPCIPEGVTKVCSKGKSLCVKGKQTTCSHAVLPLSPSCLAVEDLDCNNRPDSATFGRRSKQNTISSLSSDFKILSQTRSKQTTYFLVVRIRNGATFLELWILGKGSLQSIVLLKESLWHSSLRSLYSTGKIFPTLSHNILIGYCLAPNKVKRCVLLLADIKTKSFRSLTLPKFSTARVISDFFYKEGMMALLYFDEKAITEKKEENITSTIRLYKLQENSFSLHPTTEPTTELRFSRETSRFHFPLYDFRILASGKILLFSFVELVAAKNEVTRTLTAHLLEKGKWTHYTYSTNKASLINGASLLYNDRILFPYQYSSARIHTLKMKWTLTEMSFDLVTNQWKRRKPLLQVEGIIRTRGVLRKGEGDVFAISETTCDNVPDSLSVYTFNSDGKQTGRYLFSTNSNPRSLMIHQTNENLILVWLSGNELLCGGDNYEKVKLHWLEFGNCKP